MSQSPRPPIAPGGMLGKSICDALGLGGFIKSITLHLPADGLAVLTVRRVVTVAESETIRAICEDYRIESKHDRPDPGDPDGRPELE